MLILGEDYNVSPLFIIPLNFSFSNEFLPAASICFPNREFFFTGEKLGYLVKGILSVRLTLSMAGVSRNFIAGPLGIEMCISGSLGSPAIWTWIDFRFGFDTSSTLNMGRGPSLEFLTLVSGVSFMEPNPKLLVGAFYRLYSAWASGLGCCYFGGGLFESSVFFIWDG